MTSTMIEFQPSISLDKDLVNFENAGRLTVQLSPVMRPYTQVERDDMFSPLYYYLGTDGRVAKVSVEFDTLQADLQGVVWNIVKPDMAFKYIESGDEGYRIAYNLLKLFFQPVIAHHGKQDYVLDEHRKLYVHLGNIFSTTENPDESWLQEGYVEATGHQEQELLLWRM